MRGEHAGERGGQFALDHSRPSGDMETFVHEGECAEKQSQKCVRAPSKYGLLFYNVSLDNTARNMFSYLVYIQPVNILLLN